MIRIQEQCHEISEKPKETGSHAYANTDKLKSISNQLTFNYISNQGYLICSNVWCCVRIHCVNNYFIIFEYKIDGKMEMRMPMPVVTMKYHIGRLQWQRCGIHLINLFIFKSSSLRWLLLFIESMASNSNCFVLLFRFQLLLRCMNKLDRFVWENSLQLNASRVDYNSIYRMRWNDDNSSRHWTEIK